MISKTYSPQEIEDKWYRYWIENRYFNSQPNPDKQPYTIVIPPPNVTGVLHMGHMLNNTIQDILVRKARMEGKEACWVPGTDHASIATEAKVVAMLKERGIAKRDLSRDEFLEYCWEWTHKYGGIILQQLRKLGTSCDWDRTRFTMEPNLYDSVIDVFIDLYGKGDIYRGHRMVNWDPQARTTVSDEEVMMKEVHQKLVYLRYDLEDGSGSVTIATTRPETIMADAAICVNPDDPRYQNLVGKKAIIPLINRAIPIIADEYVEMESGRGAESDARPRHQRLRIGQETQPTDHRSAGRRRYLERQGANSGRGRPLRGPQKDHKNAGSRREFGQDRRVPIQRRALGAHQRRNRAAAVGAVVFEDGAAKQARAGQRDE